MNTFKLIASMCTCLMIVALVTLGCGSDSGDTNGSGGSAGSNSSCWHGVTGDDGTDYTCGCKKGEPGIECSETSAPNTICTIFHRGGGAEDCQCTAYRCQPHEPEVVNSADCECEAVQAGFDPQGSTKCTGGTVCYIIPGGQFCRCGADTSVCDYEGCIPVPSCDFKDAASAMKSAMSNASYPHETVESCSDWAKSP